MFEDRLVDLSQIVASSSVAIAVGFNAATFYWARKADQAKITEGVLKTFREMKRTTSSSRRFRLFGLVKWQEFKLKT